MNRKYHILQLAFLILATLPVQAQAELRRPTLKPFFVEAKAGLAMPLTDLELASCDAVNSGCALQWGTRPELAVAAGMRVWDPLMLDVGLRLGYGVQWSWSVGGSDFRYDPGISLVELSPFARGAIFPFGTEDWGISGELGLGLVFAFGGTRGGNDFPEETQMMLRIRIAFGAVWRWSASMAWIFNAASLTADVSVTDQFKDAVGSVVSWEPHAAFQYRF
ncbi:MAG: hypothetical protein ACI9WU_003714 [Myxococcota bacterium]